MPYHRCADCGLTSYSAAGYATPRVCPTCTAPLSDATRVYVPAAVVDHEVTGASVRELATAMATADPALRAP
jgi:hypothetical protein